MSESGASRIEPGDDSSSVDVGLLATFVTTGRSEADDAETERVAVASFESDMFAFDLYVRPTTFVYAALAIVVVALISGWPGLRALRRLHIPTVVKERSS